MHSPLTSSLPDKQYWIMIVYQRKMQSMRASDKLFSLAQNAGNGTLLKQLINEFRPIQNNIDNIRDALRDNDITQAVNSLATADIRTVNITKGLPP